MFTVNCLYSTKYYYDNALVMDYEQGVDYVRSNKISSKLCRDRYIII